ncbi:MAG: DUF1295 domain-containing protein [Eubacteriales bacterium]|nr:DUF1295 domain-containing protein [Eubacteriales bacterium]
MKNIISMVLTVLAVFALTIVGFLEGVILDQNQLETLIILSIIAGASALYCFVVGEITKNTSQMDKLWSLLPIVYVWVIAGRGGMKPRLIMFAVLVTLWGMRLTMNFARKGAYRLKFWEGKEDYRWAVLRKNPILGNKFVWPLFNLFFISLYQNALVLAITLPALAVMSSEASLMWVDFLVFGLAFLFLLLETVADEEQRKFYQKRNALLKEGKKLEELPSPYNRGFNTKGLWSMSRHPNYCGEQGCWLSLYLFTIGAGVCHYAIFNWSMIGPLFLVLLFLGSSQFGESVSSSKYPEYKNYQKKVSKYIPLPFFRYPAEK